MIVKHLGVVDYATTAAAMQAFTGARTDETPDELWLCQHPAVYTQGQAGKSEHVLDVVGIPIVQSNRGGQVTYHGPGQVVAYPLINLKRLDIYVKEYVFRLEAALIQTLAAFDIVGHRVVGAPGIYVRLADPRAHGSWIGPARNPFEGLGKVAALGIKVSRHCSYHGLALNVSMDLSPFERINPCGYPGLRTVDLTTLGGPDDWRVVSDVLEQRLAAHLSP